MSLVNHLKDHIALKLPLVASVIDIDPNNEIVVASPIAGDPDLTQETSISLVQHIATGFLLPKRGIIESINMIQQGNTGGGIAIDTRWSVCEVEKDNSALTGLRHKSTLATGLTTCLDNFNGNKTLTTGNNIPVPSQFVVAIKSGFGTGGNIFIQNMKNAGAVPGMAGTVGGAVLTAAATYTFATTDLGSTPGAIVLNDQLNTTNFKGLSLYIKWRGH